MVWTLENESPYSGYSIAAKLQGKDRVAPSSLAKKRWYPDGLMSSEVYSKWLSVTERAQMFGIKRPKSQPLLCKPLNLYEPASASVR